jgi:type I restriction enzyme S subunit
MAASKKSSLPQGWTASNLESVVTFFAGGTSFLKSEYVPTGTPVLTKGDVKPFGRVEHSGRFVDTGHAIAERYRFTEPGDLLVTTRDLTTAADFLGLVAPVPSDKKYLVNQGANVFRLDGDLVDPRYFVYWTCGYEYRDYIKSAVSGSTQVHIRKADWLNAPLNLPPMEVQEQIAKVLGGLDDKIELNRCMNETLEAMARAIFQSWFVDFDPVRAKASGESADAICQRLGLTPELLALFPDSFEDSELGEIPLGWLPTRLDAILELAYGKALKATDRIDGEIPVYGSGGVTGYHNESLINGPAIIVGRKGTNSVCRTPLWRWPIARQTAGVR